MRQAKEPITGVDLFQDVIARTTLAYRIPREPAFRHIRPGTKGRVVLILPSVFWVQFEGHTYPVKLDAAEAMISFTLAALEH